MRRLLALTATLALALGTTASASAPLSSGPAVPVSPVVPPVPGAVVTSRNVTHLGTIPLDGVGVSMRVVTVGRQVRAFVSGAAGLSIYDATDPVKPLLLGRLPIYNWENEDIAVSADGRWAMLTEFDGLLYLHVVDVSDPTLPVLTGTLKLAGAHTVECANPACTYLFGSEGQTFDIRDRAHPVELPRAQSWGELTGAGTGGHNVHQDASGTWISDTDPLVVFRESPDPLHLTVLTHGAVTENTAYQHNNVRPRADQYRPRAKGASLGGPLRPGELLLGEGETNFSGTCDGGSGAFSTWSMAGFERGVPMRQLHVLRPVSGSGVAQDPAVNGLGCSGHWFSQKTAKNGKVLVAGAWYEHGTRFLSVEPTSGAITQLGFFQPRRGSTSASYWMPGSDVVWAVDYHSGIDILRFDQSAAKRPTAAAVESSWLLRLHDVDPLAAAVRTMCTARGKVGPSDRAHLHQLLTAG